jgi:hypothetical protein
MPQALIIQNAATNGIDFFAIQLWTMAADPEGETRQGVCVRLSLGWRVQCFPATDKWAGLCWLGKEGRVGTGSA